ncbi:beta-methylgalactoside transporter [Erysipelothrix inopinata]|uniref:Beta-methylgalactoside transporter n=2 Tax=Erysipelothrix inopinata TaxID=225084 RepID=A0A7G9S1U5_9FIRM|nr:beta-methylgalactoside transporter [Erysipelothrix inopinata]
MIRLGFSKSYRDSLDELELKKQKEDVKNFFLKNGLYIAMLVFITFVAISRPAFLSTQSIVNNINLVAKRLPIALGIAGLIIISATDLSAGRILGITALVSTALLQRADYPTKLFPELGNMSILLVLVCVIIIGALFGLFNGFFVAKFKIHPFIVTLGTQLIIQTLALSLLNLNGNSGQALGGLRPEFTELITGGFYIGGIKIQFYIIYAIIITAIIWFIWNKTIFGKNIFAIGSNAEAAAVSGINVDRVIIVTFILAGVLFGINGFIESAVVGSNSATTGVGAEFDAIAACVIGGISFSGGIGKVRGVVVGVLLLQLITTSLIFLGISPEWQYAIKGLVIIVTVAIDMRKTIARK